MTDKQIFYLCDREVCKPCSNKYCSHTTVIEHAKNFELNGNYYWEKKEPAAIPLKTSKVNKQTLKNLKSAFTEINQEGKEQVRKETAKEILSELYNNGKDYYTIYDLIEELAEKYGVEVEQ